MRNAEKYMLYGVPDLRDWGKYVTHEDKVGEGNPFFNYVEIGRSQ